MRRIYYKDNYPDFTDLSIWKLTGKFNKDELQVIAEDNRIGWWPKRHWNTLICKIDKLCLELRLHEYFNPIQLISRVELIEEI